jgi:hypothetical protein
MPSPYFFSSVLYPISNWISFGIIGRSATSTIIASACGVIGASISWIIAPVATATGVVAEPITHVVSSLDK